MQMRITLRNLAFAAGAISAATLSPPANAEDRTIRLGQVNLSFYAVVGGIVQEVLEQDGYKVEVTAGSHGDIFPKLGAGDVDILAAAWLPDGHAPLYAEVKDRTFIVGELYDDARLYWAVPEYVPADLVRSIDDLKKPDVARGWTRGSAASAQRRDSWSGPRRSARPTASMRSATK
jgi:glycine betaine/proline transport system substrate-binding protein